MANTRSGGANNEGAGDTSATKAGAATNEKDPRSATTSTSSASGRETGSLSTRETSDEPKPNPRRLSPETKGKDPIVMTTTSSATTPVSRTSMRGRSNPSTPDSPKSSAKKLKGSTRKASTPKTSDRVKKSTISASAASNDSTGVPPSPVAALDKTVKRKIDEHNSTKNKHDASESGTRPLKQQKRLNAEGNGSVLRYEESGAHGEDNQAHLSQVVNRFCEGYTSGGREAPEVILETVGSKTDVEKSAPISEAHITADLRSQNIVAESSPAMDTREPTDNCSELTLNVAMARKADSSKFVEYWVPARLSRVQLEMYCYTLLSNLPALQSHPKTDSVGALRNILVSLRKCCDHPYLVDEMLQASLPKGHPVSDIVDIGVRASGKLLLLDKMLREIKEKRQRVLILSQFCDGAGYQMGDILDDFVRQSFGFESFKRVKHGFCLPNKEGAMSMLNDTTKGRFIFLIDSRACVPSIKLSSVDVIIIYGSDWNPTNDLRVLRKISIGSQSECVPIFRLYSSCTVEEKALILAKHDRTFDGSVQNITPILSHSLLSWGASFLFSRLEGLENDAYLSKDSDAEKLFMDKVLSEYLPKLSNEDDPSTKTSNAAISQAHLSGPFHSRDSVVVGETEGISAPDSDLPKFWVNLLGRKSPCWQYITGPAQRRRRKRQSIEEGKIPADEAAEASTKRRKISGNKSHQQDSPDLVIEAIVSGEKELLSVPDFHEKQHLSKDVLLNRITEKRINLVDLVFSLREKNIHDKQANEVALFDMHRHKGVVKLREACRIVVEHLRRSQADPEDRGGQTKLIVEWFTMLLYAFVKHMRYQREKLDLQQSKVWTKELQSKENFLHEAKYGQLDHTFDQCICLPDSGFATEEFSYFSSCVDTATLGNCLQSLHETSAMEVTLVRSVIPSYVINAEAAINGSAEVLIHNEGRLASEGIGLTENMISNSLDCIDSQGGASLAVQDQLNSGSAIDNSINQESSSGDPRRTEHVERQSGVGSQPLPRETDQHLGDAEMEVNTDNGGDTHADPPYLEPQTVAPVPSQASLQMSKEVEAEANIVMQSAQLIVAPVQLLQREAEQVDRSGITSAQTLQPETQPSASREPSQASLQMSKEVEAEANVVMQSAQPIVAPVQLLQREADQVDRSGITPAQTLQPEMQPSPSREVYTPTDLIIQSAQPSIMPTELSQRDVEQASLSRVPSSQCLPSAMHPSVPLSSILLERTHPDQCQPSHPPEAAPDSSAQLFLVAPMMFNHPPVGDDALKNELHRLRLYSNSLNKTHELKQSQLRTEYSQEMEKLKQKYDLLLQEQDSTHLQQTKTLNNLCEKVLLSQSLADNLRKEFISSGEQVRAHSPPNHQTPQTSQQVPMRPSAVASTASPTASSSAGRPPPIHHVQPLLVDRPSPSSQVVGPRPSMLNNSVRSTPTTFTLTPVLPRGSFGVQKELACAPAPHLQRRLPPQVHSISSANQQQLPARLESMSARTWFTPVTPINIRQSCLQAVPPGNPSLSSLHPSSHPTIPAPLGPSSSHQIQQVPRLPSSSQPKRLPSPVPSIPNPVLPLTSPRGLTTTSSVSSAALNVLSAALNVLPSKGVGPSSPGSPQSDSDSASLDEWLTDLGLPSDPPGVARADVICLSDDEETDDQTKQKTALIAEELQQKVACKLLVKGDACKQEKLMPRSIL